MTSISDIEKALDTINKFKWIKIITDIHRNISIIFALTFIGFSLSFIYTFGQKPIYTASALIKVDNRKASEKYNVIELIKSNYILKQVIESNKLDIIQQPKEIPYLGTLYQKFISKSKLDEPSLNQYLGKNFITKWNWGNKSIDVSMFELPKVHYDEAFTLRYIGDYNYSLLLNNKVILQGKIGEKVKSKKNMYLLYVMKINATVGSQFLIEKQTPSKSIGILRKNLKVISDKNSDYIHIQLSGDNKKSIVTSLGSLVSILSNSFTDISQKLDRKVIISIIDEPILDKPSKIKNNTILHLLYGTLSGFVFGIFISLIKEAIRRRTKVSDPEQLEEIMGKPVYATVPLSKAVKETGGVFNKFKRQRSLLFLDDPYDPAIESLRSMRTSLHFALLEAKNNIVMITGPSSGVGKSFISSNFSAVLSTSEQRVLLIDADLRLGYLHNLFSIPVSPGLSDIISDHVPLEDAIHSTRQLWDNNCLDIIPRGETPPNPSELLMHSNFEKLLKNMSESYDLIIIDTPPVNEVADASIIGRYSGVVFMVIFSNKSSMKDIAYSVTRLEHNGIETKGFVFNGYVVKKTNSLYENRYNK